jgi:PAS domain-containing protein
VGDPASWPQSLKTTLGIILHSKFPMFLWWGPRLICFYNDAYRPSLGNNGKHPEILGMAGEEAWREMTGAVGGVLVTCHETTLNVRARQDLVTMLEQLRLSREAAELGMFDMDLKKGTMEWDRRCRTLFGIAHEAVVTYENDFVKVLHPEDRGRITAIISLVR